MVQGQTNTDRIFAEAKPKFTQKWIWASLFFAGVGCGGSQDLMPLESGREWQYYERSPQGKKVLRIVVAERCRVGREDGWLLDGPCGQSRLAWKGSRLLASELTAVRFDPPIQILNSAVENDGWAYDGECDGRIGRVPVSGDLIQKAEKVKIGGIQRDSIRVTLEIKIGTAKTSLDTWFVKEIGIIRQEQRINGNQVAYIEWISG